MKSLLVYLGVLGNIVSVLILVSPIKTFWRIVKNKSTEDFELAPYVITFLNCVLWVYYAASKPDVLVAINSAVGIILQAVYVSLFLLYASPARRVKAAILVGILDVGLLGAIFAVTQFAMNQNLRVKVVGAVCVCTTMTAYASPLTIMKTVITTKSVEFMPFLLSFSIFVNGGVWTLYAIIRKDVFIGIPNGTGFILGTIQLILYMIYMDSKMFRYLRKPTIEQQQQQQPLVAPGDQCDEEGGNLM